MKKDKRSQVIESRQKRYVLDTSVLIYDYKAIDKFEDNLVDIPMQVLGELDKAKKFSDGEGMAARRVLRIIHEYGKLGNLKEGVPTKNGGSLRIVYLDNCNMNELPVGMERNNDSFIILTAIKLQKIEEKSNPHHQVILVTNDVQMSVTANVCGVKVEDYRHEKVSEVYSGILDVKMKPGWDPAYLYDVQNGDSNGEHIIPYFPDGTEDVLANQGIIHRFSTNGDGLHRILSVYDKELNRFRHVKAPPKQKGKERPEAGPINDRQAIAFSHLMNPNIHIVTLVGVHGSGKTLLATLAAFKHTNASVEERKQDQAIIYRPNLEIGKELGFLPGDLEEKFSPWTQPILDCVRVIQQKSKDKKSLSSLPNLTISPINHIRGRTLHNMFVVVDEAQNLTPHEITTIVTRMGQDGKIVFTGDPSQIDNPHLNSEHNGLVYLAQKLKDHPNCAHVFLDKSERSKIAEIALERLR